MLYLKLRLNLQLPILSLRSSAMIHQAINQMLLDNLQVDTKLVKCEQDLGDVHFLASKGYIDKTEHPVKRDSPFLFKPFLKSFLKAFLRRWKKRPGRIYCKIQ